MTLYYVTTPAQLSLLARAIDIASGLSEPIRGTVVGGPDTLPVEFSGPGTPGWTDAVFRGSWVSADFTQAAVEIVPEMLAFAGQEMMVDDQLVTFPAEADGVDTLPPALLEENGAFWWNGADYEAPPPETPPP